MFDISMVQRLKVARCPTPLCVQKVERLKAMTDRCCFFSICILILASGLLLDNLFVHLTPGRKIVTTLSMDSDPTNAAHSEFSEI